MSFATTTELMPHQVQAVAKVLPSRVGALFMDMGTGKGRTLLELARLRQAKWDRLFWLCPVSARLAMRDEVLKHTTLTEGDVCVWEAGRAPDLARRVHIVGIESISQSDRAYLALHGAITPSSFVAVDESGYIKGHKSKRTTRLTDMAAQARYRLVMTGTLLTQGVVDLYAQMRFLSPRILGYNSFYTFARNHLEYKQRKTAYGKCVPTGRILRAHDVDVLAAKMAPYTYQVRKDECLTLPAKIYTTRWCSMTPAQRQLYDRAKRKILLELGYDDWSAVRIFHLFTALQTVVCGWWQDGNELHEVEHDRLDVLMGALDQIPDGEHVVIWAKYRRAVQEISAALAEAYGPETVHQYYGDVGQADRHAALAKWRSAGRFLVATQAAGGHALEMVEAAYVVFYADGFKFSERLQAEDRCHRKGQKRSVTYITITCAESIDTRIAQAIAKKESTLDAFVAEVEIARERGLKQRAIELVQKL